MLSAAVRLSVRENLRFAVDFQNDAPDAFTKWHARVGPTFKARIPGHRLVSSTDQTIVKHVLNDSGALFSKGRFADDLSPFWGKSTVQLADGADWARQRPVCTGFFHQGANRTYEQAVERRLEPMLDRLRHAAQAGQPISLYYPVRDVCYAAVCDVWFPCASEAELAQLAELIRTGTDIASRRMLQLLAVPLSWPTRANQRYRRIAEQAHAMAERIIEQARNERSDHLLGAIAKSLDAEPARALSNVEVRNNFFMFAIACYEWPTLGWLLLELSTRKAVRLQAIDEVLRASRPASDIQPSLPYLYACIKETFRLRPPAPLIGRTVIMGSSANRVELEVGQSFVIPVKAIQRDPQRWEMPEDFLPERFLGQRADPGYLAFGMGPRGCIGQSMATRVMQTAVAGILAQFDFEIVGNAPPRMHDKLKSYPAGGVPVRLHPH